MVTQTATITVNTFSTEVDVTAARSSLIESDERMAEATIRTQLYYPYQVIMFKLSAETLLSTVDEKMVCGVDLVNGKELLIDERPTSMSVTVPETDVLTAQQSREEAISAARYYVLQISQRRLKFTHTPDITLLESRLLYRPFHLADCQTTNDESYRYIVDSVSGNFHRVYN